MYDYLIVGSGLFGSTFAYQATRLGKKCLVIDKRPHLGGNVYCDYMEGINVHKYGAHIFHTNNKDVWDFVNSLVPFNRYTNSPVANYHGKLFNLPFNMNTFYQMWGVTTPEEATTKIEEQKAEAVAKMKAEGVTDPRNLEEQGLCLVGKDIFEKLIKEYTEKQWGRSCRDLPAFIIKRLPVRLVFDNNYFNDAYQGIPIGGYNKLIEKLLEKTTTITGLDFFNPIIEDIKIVTPENRKGTKVVLDRDLNEVEELRSSIKVISKREWKSIAKELVYTGPIDEYFGFCYGKLNWRTVSFKTRVVNTPNYQGNAVVNYTSHEQPYTRVIEHKHFEMFGQAVYDCPRTVISEEYSTEYKEGMEPYYPVNDDNNNALADRYRQLAEKEKDVIFGGRLAQYKYYDMAPIIEQVLNMFK